MGVAPDYAKAMHWFRLAAEQGIAKTQYTLGLMHRKGEGVPQDYAEAARWFRRGAEQGNGGAQLGLGLMYVAGKGVLQDYTRAHMWLNLAAAKASHSRIRELAVEGRDRVASLMTGAQVLEAQRLAREWRPTGEGADR